MSNQPFFLSPMLGAIAELFQSPFSPRRAGYRRPWNKKRKHPRSPNVWNKNHKPRLSKRRTYSYIGTCLPTTMLFPKSRKTAADVKRCSPTYNFFHLAPPGYAWFQCKQTGIAELKRHRSLTREKWSDRLAERMRAAG